MTQRIKELLDQDALFKIIRETPTEDILCNDDYLEDIIEKRFYSTPEVASWFGVSDAQLRYYIKPFQEYIFAGEGTPTSPSAIRLTFIAILRLRMILLLKDEYRVKGLKQVLGIDDYGQVNPRPYSSLPTIDVKESELLSKKVDALSNVLNQMLMTGLFEIKQQDSEQNVIMLNQDFLQKQFQPLPDGSTRQLQELKTQTDQLMKENEQLKDQIQELRDATEKDIAVTLRERRIENEVVSQLRIEALKNFSNQKKISMFEKLFYSAEVEKEKELFIADYIHHNLYQRLEEKLEEYHKA